MQTAQLPIGNARSLKNHRAIRALPPNPCATLKKQTEAQRGLLEQELNSVQRFSTLEEYRDLLGKLYGIYAPIEAVLWRALEPLKERLSLSERRQSARLSADLTACGLSNADIVALPRWQAIAPFPTVAEALGRMYVLESATLRGQVIARLLRKRFALQKKAGVAFFHSHGCKEAERWRQLRSAITAHLITARQEDQAIGAAMDTYRILQCSLVKGRSRNGISPAYLK